MVDVSTHRDSQPNDRPDDQNDQPDDQNDQPDDFGRSPIHYAAADGDAPEVSRLLADGADAGAFDAAHFTPLHFAAQEQHPEVARVLIDAGADVGAADRWGNTPLWRAVFTSHGKLETATLLLAAGADPEAANDNGVSARELARRIGLNGI